jgi:Flp pilus assembly protein TadG
MHVLDSRLRSQRGLVMALVALLAVVLLGFAALAIDSSHIEGAAQQLQAAADSAALAAAAKLSGESSASGGSYPLTRAAAVSLAARNSAAGAGVMVDANSGNSASGDVVVGTWDGAADSFTPTTVSPNAVRVTARRTTESSGGALSTIMGGLFGAGEAQVSRSATATCTPPSAPMIVVLDPSATGALQLKGNASVDAGAGSVQVNSSAACGIKLGGSTRLTAASVQVVGHACYSGSSLVGNLEDESDPVPDPLAFILPGTAGWSALKNSMAKPAGANGQITSSGTFSPGYYPRGLSINNSVSVTLSTGTYLFGGGFTTLGGATVRGTNVTILLDEGATLSLGGGSSVWLTPPSSGSLQGLVLMAHRGTSSATALDFGGNGTISIEGSIYAPAAGIAFGGTGSMQSFGQVVCNLLAQSGNSRITGAHVVPTSGGGGVTLVH